MGDVTTFSNLEEKYDKSAGAEALFFANEHNKALRVEAHTLHVEFTDGLYIGRDPQGLLYYNNNESFDGSDLKYKVTIATNKAGKCAHIKFFHDKEENCRIEFLAKDPAGGVTAAGMDGYIGTGKWIPLKMNTSPAVVKKYNDSRTITFDVQQTDVPTATITDSKDVLKSKAVDVVGTFYYKAINDVKLGKYANYNNDRVVFYMNDYTGKDFTGFFMPKENSQTDLGSPDSQTFENITWTPK